MIKKGSNLDVVWDVDMDENYVWWLEYNDVIGGLEIKQGFVYQGCLIIMIEFVGVLLLLGKLIWMQLVVNVVGQLEGYIKLVFIGIGWEIYEWQVNEYSNDFGQEMMMSYFLNGIMLSKDGCCLSVICIGVDGIISQIDYDLFGCIINVMCYLVLVMMYVMDNNFVG